MRRSTHETVVGQQAAHRWLKLTDFNRLQALSIIHALRRHRPLDSPEFSTVYVVLDYDSTSAPRSAGAAQVLRTSLLRSKPTLSNLAEVLLVRYPSRFMGVDDPKNPQYAYLRYTHNRVMRVSEGHSPADWVGHLAALTPTGEVPAEELFEPHPFVSWNSYSHLVYTKQPAKS